MKIIRHPAPGSGIPTVIATHGSMARRLVIELVSKAVMEEYNLRLDADPTSIRSVQVVITPGPGDGRLRQDRCTASLMIARPQNELLSVVDYYNVYPDEKGNYNLPEGTRDTIKANLPKGYKVGRCINNRGNVYRVLSHGRDFSAFPGGRGVVEMELEWVKPGTLTEKELRELDGLIDLD